MEGLLMNTDVLLIKVFAAYDGGQFGIGQD